MAENKLIRHAVQRTLPVVGIHDSLAFAAETMTAANASVLAVKIGEEVVGLVTVVDVMCGLSNEKGGLETKIFSLEFIRLFSSDM